MSFQLKLFKETITGDLTARVSLQFQNNIQNQSKIGLVYPTELMQLSDGIMACRTSSRDLLIIDSTTLTLRFDELILIV